jgi:hypothetical protein
MSDICLSCVKNYSTRIGSAGSFKAKAIVNHSPTMKVGGVGTIVANNSLKASNEAKLAAQGELKGKSQLSIGLWALSESGIGKIRGSVQLDKGNLSARLSSISKIPNVKTDKFAGSINQLNNINDFNATQKLYPTRDIVTSLNNSYFVDSTNGTQSLFANIDEGVFIGNYTKHGKNSKIIADEKLTFIQPSSVMSDGDFRYTCEVTRPIDNAEESFLFIRAAAPTYTKSSDIPPQYRIHNIKLLDPSGNVVIKYKDVFVRGDADYQSDYVNFVTYISEPETNNLLLRTWESGYPLMGYPSGYTLNLDFSTQCFYDPFSEAFNKGYEESCEQANLNKNTNFALTRENSIRISAIEICNSGGYDSVFSSGVGILRDNYLPFYTDVAPIGQRLTKYIVPIDMIASDVDVDIYPEAYSLWESNPDSYGNKDNSLTNPARTASKLQDDYPFHYIKLLSSTPHIDSGRLTLRFTNLPPKAVWSQSDGSFTQAFSNKSYNIAEFAPSKEDDNFFIIDEVYLKVIAKKAPGSVDYALDVLGYNDDKLLNRTPKIGAFLQNELDVIYLGDEYQNFIVSELGDYIAADINQRGFTPQVSGFRHIDDFGISTLSISDKDQLYIRDITLNPAKDHYELSQSPLIDSTSFKEYKIPLTIYDDPVLVGKSVDYRNSSYIENLFVDLYPIPSGAIISTVQLVVKYKPSNGLMLHTFAQGSKELTRRTVNLTPSVKQSIDPPIFSNAPLSYISGIPQGYTNVTKTNSSRRWRGVGGTIVNGPYDPRAFDFSFYNPEVNVPFLSGYFNFNQTTGNVILSEALGNNLGNVSGLYVGDLQNSLISNIGNRFRNNDIFSTQLPGYNSQYRTIDWTSLSSGQMSFVNDPLYGKISDSYEHAVRTSGSNGYISFPPFNSGFPVGGKGFGFYLRFTPDVRNSGVGYNLFNSGVLAAQYTSNLGFILCYENENLCLKYPGGQIKDTRKYYEYSYPLNVLVTFGELRVSNTPNLFIPIQADSKFKLYVDSDNRESVSSLIGVSNTISPVLTSNITVGHCASSGVGLNMFVHEIGLTSIAVGSNNTTKVCNIVQNAPVVSQSWIDYINNPQISQFARESASGLVFHPYDRPSPLKYILAEDFFKSVSSKYIDNATYDKNYLYEYIDEDVSSWKLGAFKICSFSADFDSFTKRIGKDFVNHYIKSNGIAYSEIFDLPLPSNIYASGLSYHTQIENDSLRVFLSDVPESGSFYSAHPRISKTLPRGYNFVEDALVVDSIIQHETLNNISWSDGKIGPKLIVSLYTPTKDPSYAPSKKNWGLVNRAIHFLEPSGCWQKLSSTFNYQDLLDISEPWANFDFDQSITEFDTKYYSTDINRMYLQYDLVYPSSAPFESQIKLHSVNVRLENALVSEENANNGMNLYSNADKKWLEDINLYVYGRGVMSDDLNLYTSGTFPDSTSGNFNMFVTSAYYASGENIKLFTLNKNTIDSSSSQLFGATAGEDYYLGPNFYVSGRYNKFDEQSLPITIINRIEDQSSSGSLPIFTKSVGLIEDTKSSVILHIQASPTRSSLVYREVMPMFINSPAIPLKVDGEDNGPKMNLWIDGKDFSVTSIDSSINMFLVNYPALSVAGSQQYTITWNSDYTGKNIAVDDNKYAYLDANDEIRGVELLCYGNCQNTNSCSEMPVILHEDRWSTQNDCVDGGIFRAKNTYTNLETSGFKTDVGYSGHFYGVRKYTNLIPQAPYLVNIVGKTGSKATIELPTEYIESEYGIDEIVINDITANSGYTNYTNRKLTADSIFSNQSYYDRQINEKFGKSVAVKGNLACIGAPGHNLEYTEYDAGGNLVDYTLDDAGAVYIYRRDNRPSGYSWPEGTQKSPWYLEERLYLPSGFLKDYYDRIETNTIDGINLPATVIQRKWNVGQEGRQFGHSLDLAISNSYKSFGQDNREVLVVGGPSAKWNRDFEDLYTSGVQIGLIIFTDEFTPTIPAPRDRKPRPYYSYQDVLDTIYNKDLLFRYFADPPIRFDVKLIICEPIKNIINATVKEFPEPKPDFIIKKQIERIRGIRTDEKDQRILSGIKEAFHEAFPYDENKLHNNIPPILGLYADNSASMRGALGKAKDLFKNYYLDYSFASGLRDFYGVRNSGACVEYISNLGAAENWVFMAQTILNDVLDTGRLIQNDQIKYLTSGVGQEFFNENLSQFNYPPESGGRVYIFEKESGAWNLIQEIRSPNITYGTPDRFGHAVAISDDTEVIAIGSPYISEACKVYEYKPEEKDRLYGGLYSWLGYKNSITGGLLAKYRNLISDYENWASAYGIEYANKILYSKIDSTDKFEARKYLNIQEYQNIYTYGYNNINYIFGTWSFIPEHFAPTSRLGYSVDVNEDGTVVAFGAPTDSFNEWEDGNVWYKNEGYSDPNNDENLNTNLISPSWINSTNAGAVRLFEARKYYPHNSVVEFGKFGNLQESMSFPEDSGHFNYLATAFSDMNFRKTEFTEVKIPQEAGLAFIITPEVDSLSDEVADNILNWLALGDRNLVLVGNDPIWEKDGIYEDSNDIVNKILERLQSRLRIFPARNSYEALSSGCSLALPSYIPRNTTPSYIQPITTNAYGVGDIRMYLKNSTNFAQFMPCTSKNDKLPSELIDSDESAFEIINEKCELPLKHLGDLRAEWLEVCETCNGTKLYYPVNWAYLFRTYIPPCCSLKVGPFDFPQQEPVPLMVAGDYVTKITKIPASPAVSGVRPIFRTITKEDSSFQNIFDAPLSPSSVAFIWNSGQNTSSYLNLNDGQINSDGLFYTPEIFDDRQSLIMANAIPQSEILEGKEIISQRGYYCVEETLDNRSSKIIFIAGVFTESENNLYSGFGDRNINFYANLVGRTIEGESLVAQLGGWTNRASFVEAYEKSFLFNLLQNVGNNVEENVTTISDQYDVCWIANAAGIPSPEELNQIKSWLNEPNKKLIITYDNTTSQVLIAKQISDLLNSRIKPLYLPVLDKYPLVYLFGINKVLEFNPIHPVSTGFNTNTSISSFTVVDSREFVPLALVPDTVPICYDTAPVFDKKLITNGYWRAKSGVTKVSFPALPGSGYKIFITTISETPAEKESLFIGTQNVNRSITLSSSASDSEGLFSYEFDKGYTVGMLGDFRDFGREAIENQPITYSFDAQVLRDSSTINFYIGNNSERLRVNTNSYLPKTTRLLGISGVLVPIETVRTTTTSFFQVFDRYEYYRISDPQPERIITETVLSPILNDNTVYCVEGCEDTLGGKQIADGPVIVAQEIEHFSQFMNGVARSRITVISDSSLVQGQCMGDEDFRMSADTVRFLRSLYPYTSWPDTNAGRQYTIMTKVMSPERGSPQKYRSIVNNSGLAHMFGDFAGSPVAISAFSNKESRYDPKFVKRPKKNPWPDDATAEQIEAIKRGIIRDFKSVQTSHGATAMFSGVVDGTLYRDAGIGGGMPELMKDKGYDYLDFDIMQSGYPGDLFGYSISLYKNKLVVGSPYSAFSRENISSWDYILNGGASSGIELSYNGGAGAAYIFERNNRGSGLHGTFTPWSLTQKLRPNSINIGANSGIAIMGDRFGNDIDIDGDIIVIGAPGHDYGNYVINGSGEFIRRCFNPEFNIPSRTVIDLGNSGVRNTYDPSVVADNTNINGGAIFTFENKIVDWPTKKQEWVYVEKVIENAPFYHSGILYTGDSSDRFGESVFVDRSRRTDADYTILGGSRSETSNRQLSGINQFVIGAGATFVTDIMLRGQSPAIQSPNAFIDAKFFGETNASGQPTLLMSFLNNNDANKEYRTSGVIYSNDQGEIFIEASGQDPVLKGFIEHRPYIKSVEGTYFFGIPNSGNLPLFIDGIKNSSGNMNLFTGVDSIINVYNDLGLYTSAVDGIVSNDPSGMLLYVHTPDPTVVSASGLILYMASGVGSYSDSLNLRIRGK